jgi:hypothetical protein
MNGPGPKEHAMPRKRPLTKAAKKRRLRLKQEKRNRSHKYIGIPVLKSR